MTLVALAGPLGYLPAVLAGQTDDDGTGVTPGQRMILDEVRETGERIDRAELIAMLTEHGCRISSAPPKDCFVCLIAKKEGRPPQPLDTCMACTGPRPIPSDQDPSPANFA